MMGRSDNQVQWRKEAAVVVVVVGGRGGGGGDSGATRGVQHQQSGVYMRCFGWAKRERRGSVLLAKI